MAKVAVPSFDVWFALRVEGNQAAWRVSNVGRRQVNHIEVAFARKGTTQDHRAAAVRDPACETVKVTGIIPPTIKCRNRHEADSGRRDE
jgi:hypothetical protein